MFAHWYDTALVVLTVLSTVVQLYVMWMVIYKSPKSMSEYRFFLCLYTYCDMSFTLTFGLIAHPETLYPSEYFCLDGLGALFGRTAVQGTIELAFYSASGMVMSLDYCLVYRMAVIMEDQRLYKLLVSRAGYVACFACGFLLAGGVAFLAYGFVEVTQDTTGMASRYPRLAASLPQGAIIARIKAELPSTAPSVLALFAGLALSELVSFGAVFVIMKTLKKNARHFSKKTYRLHLQLTALILLQLCTPIVLVALPLVASLLALVFLPFSMPEMLARSLLLGFALYASINSALVIAFVTPYRRYTTSQVLVIVKAVFGPFCRKKTGVTNTQTTVVFSSSQARALTSR